MPLSAEERTAFLELIPALGDDVDPRPVHRFAQAHRRGLLEEITAVPGVSRIRAAALRLLPELVPERAGRDQLLADAGNALLQPPTDHPMERLSRHPAWIGLALLELAALQGGWDNDPVIRAVELASRAFQAAGAVDIGEGEVLWAMAEEASEVGWTARARLLHEHIAEATFSSPSRRAEAWLVVGIGRLQAGEDAAPWLASLPGDEDAPSQVRTHAAWILAQVALQEGERETAQVWFEQAAASVDREADAEVAARIDAALSEMRA